ncbi:MAG: phosphodiester glycosidase family protein [Clostridia bacterium]|nr:phosphodiester glycosidase family protein [Clostridia bacterium]
MKLRTLRWVLAAVMLVGMALLISSPAEAEIIPLPLDQTVPGNPPVEGGYLSETEYKDESIHVTVEHQTVKKVKCSIVRIKIADPSQIRTAMSKDSYDDRTYAKAAAMAKQKNAIVAVNGDFFKYFYKIGYVVRQGEFYRDALNGERDVLIIDDHGDFHAVRNATSDDMAAFLANEFPADRRVINTFTLGPVLVENGVVQEITTREFQYRYKMQRVAIVQLGELEYAIVECDGKADASSGMKMADFAEYILSLFPDAILAYNLDGGGSTNVIFNNERIHRNPDARKICDILYFASAATEE